MSFLIGIVLWIVFSFLIGSYWQNKGRGFAGGFLCSLLLSPLIGILIGLLLQPNVKAQEEEQIRTGVGKKCPYCAEIIKREARVCRYCGRELKDEDFGIKDIYKPESEPPQITDLELEKLKKVAGKDAKNYSHVIETDYVCVCGRRNPIKLGRKLQICRCGRNRDVILEKYRKHTFNKEQEN